MGANFQSLREELAGSADANGVQTLIYYSPDLVRTSMVLDDADKESANYVNVLTALQVIFAKARDATGLTGHPYQHEVSVATLVAASKDRVAAKTWTGADLLVMVQGDDFVVETHNTESWFRSV